MSERLNLEEAMENVQVARKLADFFMDDIRKGRNPNIAFSAIDLFVRYEKSEGTLLEKDIIYEIFSQKIEDEMRTTPTKYFQELYDYCIERLRE